MAYFQKNDQEEQLAKMNSVGPTEQAQQTIQQGQAQQAPVGGTEPSAVSASTPNNAPKSTKSSGMGADIRKYVTQNRPQGITQGVEKATESQAQAVGQQIQKQQTDFMNQLNQQRQAQQSAYQNAQQTIQQAQNLGAQGTLDESAVSQFQKALNMAPTAPQLDLTTAQTGVNRLGNLAQEAASGRKSELLRQAFTRQGQAYTGGQSALDELILGGDTQAGERLVSQAQQAAQNQAQALRTARQQALTEGGALLGEAQQYRTDLSSGVDTAQEALRQSLQQRLESTPDIRTAIEENRLTQDMINQIGLQDNRLYGIDPLTYLRGLSTSSIATAEDLARANALAGLEQSQQDIILDPTQVGASDVSGIQALRDAVAGRQQEYESQYNPLQNKITDFNNVVNTLADMASQTNKYYATANEGSDILQIPETIGRVFSPEIQSRAAAYGIDYNALSNLVRGNYDSQRKLGYYNDLVNSLRNQYQGDISNLQSQYGYNTFLNPVSAKDGAVKHSKSSLLKKLMESK